MFGGSEEDYTNQLPTLRWLKMRISSCFGDSIVLSTVKGNPAYGTMIRRFGASAVDALHRLLYQQHLERAQKPQQVHNQENAKGGEDFGLSKLSEVAKHLNKKMIDCASNLSKNEQLKDLDKVQFKDLVRTLPPELWNFIFRLTLGENEKKLFLSHVSQHNDFNWSEHFLHDIYKSSTQNALKFSRRFFILCCMFFCINSECYFPLQMILADVIDKFSNSSTECLTILSRFGICVSKSSLVRFQVWISENEMASKGNKLRASFTMASIDNIDKNATFAAVSSQQQCRGFHGTSIQAVEPLPLSTATPSSSHEDPSTVSVSIPRRRRSLDITSLQAYQTSPSVVTTSLALGR